MASADSEPDSKLVRTSSSPLDRPLLAMVDAAALLLFAAIGRANHGVGDGDDALQTLATAAPFWVAWFVTSPLTGVYAQNRSDVTAARSNSNNNLVVDSWKQILPAWAVAVPLGCVLRGIVKGYVPPIPFVVVTLVATLVILGIGRLVFSIVEDFFVELV